MNTLWPTTATFRVFCNRNSRSLPQICKNLQPSRVPKSTRQSIRSYSASPISCWRRGDLLLPTQSLAQRVSYQRIRFASTAGRGSAPQNKVISEFERLPERYQDESGLPFRATLLSKQEALKIFGGKVNLNDANQLLKVLHGRRVAGTLEDPSVQDLAQSYDSKVVDTALDWLRENVHVDEIKNAGLRAEQELAQMEEDVLGDAERLGIYKPNPEEQTKKRGSVYGKGAFDRIREKNEREFEEQQARKKAEEEEMRHTLGPLANLGDAGGKSLETPTMSDRMAYYTERAQLTDHQVAPDMSAFTRLWPSATVLVITLAGCWFFAQVYEPPMRSTRLWPEIPASAATVFTIIGANALVFCAWRIPPFWRTMNKYFIRVPAYPYALSLVGNVFSHQAISHLGVNMLVLYLCGTRLHEEIGRGQFLALYLASGAFGSFCSLTAQVLGQSFVTSALGASGALCGILGCYLLLHSEEKVTIFGVFPPEGWPSISSFILLTILVGVDVFGLVRKKASIKAIDYVAHLGGYTMGIGSALAIREEVKRKKQREIERRRNRGLMEKIKDGKF